MTETIPIWRCIGCGSMGNAVDCTGDCAFKKVEVVGVMAHAEVLSALEEAADDLERLSALLRAIIDAGPSADAEKTYRDLKARAGSVLRSLNPEAVGGSEPVEPDTLWQCATCGQVEASVPCIGVCVRRSEEVVRATDHAAVVAKRAEAVAHLLPIRHLAERLARVTPKAGQWRASLDAMRREAMQDLQRIEQARST